MAYKKLPGEMEAKNITLEGIVDVANKADYARTMETVKIVKEILRGEKGGSSGLRITGNLQYIPKEGNAVIIGDLHGDESSLIKILKETDFVERVKKGEKLTLIFLGDYIDRGPNSIEVVNIALELKRSFRNNVVMLRGDHEVQPSSPHLPGGRDFFDENIKRHGDLGFNTYRSYLEVFGMLPLAAKSANGILFVHGGVDEKFSESVIAYGGDETETSALWNDPRDIVGTTKNTDRGIGLFFGKDVLKWLIVRGHEPVKADRLEMFEGKLATINSNYIMGYLAHKNFEVGYGYVSLENEIDSVHGIFRKI